MMTTVWFLPEKVNKERRTGRTPGSFFSDAQGLWTAGCWLARRLHQPKAFTAMCVLVCVLHIDRSGLNHTLLYPPVLSTHPLHTNRVGVEKRGAY